MKNYRLVKPYDRFQTRISPECSAYTALGGACVGYLIQYDPDMNHKYPKSCHVRTKKIWGYVLGTTVVVVLLVLSVKFRDSILLWLLPGDPSVTATALQDLIIDFRDGAPVGEAVSAFCQEIFMHGAG